MKNATISYIAFSLLILSSTTLTACQRQESHNSSAKVSTAVAAMQTSHSATIPIATTPTNSANNPAVMDLLDQFIRSDIPSMTFDQVKTLIPKTCVANDDRSISCPNIPGLISISYGGGPDGIFEMVFTGGMTSCEMLKVLVSKKFGRGKNYDIPDQDNDSACGMNWDKINPKNKRYYADVRKLKGDDEVTLQIAAEQGP
ncbi:MAG: hypothetical protein WC426_00080 [Sulfuriferula sp.]